MYPTHVLGETNMVQFHVPILKKKREVKTNLSNIFGLLSGGNFLHKGVGKGVCASVVDLLMILFAVLLDLLHSRWREEDQRECSVCDWSW